MARKKSKTLKKPSWDGRRLRFNGKEKRYRQPARTQCLLLDAFQECNWARGIDDPLPPDSRLKQLPHDRLRDAVRRLNRSVAGVGIRFECDGTGNRIEWHAMKF